MPQKHIDLVIAIRNGKPEIWCSAKISQLLVLNFDEILPHEQNGAESLLKHATRDLSLANGEEHE